MAGTTIVGRVGIRVFPDTSQFGKDLRDKLRDEVKDAERGLDKVEVEAKLDVKSLARDLAKAMRQMERQADRNPIEVDTKVSDSDPYDYLGDAIKRGKELSGVLRQQHNIEESIRRENEKAARAEMALMRERERLADNIAKAQERYAKDHRKANTDLDKALRDYDRYLSKIEQSGKALPKHLREARLEFEKINLTRTRVGFNIDAAGIEQYKDQVRNLKEWTEDEFDKIEAEIEPAVSEVMLRHVQGRLAWLARTRFVTFVPTVSAAGAAKAATALAAISGARMVGENLRSLRDFFKDVDKNLPKIALLATGFLNLTASVLSTSSNLFALSSSLAQIAPIALVLPGLMTGFGLGLYALIRPLMDTNEQLPELKKNWEALGKEMSKNFWAKAKEPWQEMIKTIFPDFRKGMADTSTEMGDLAGEFGRLFAESNAGGPMNRMFADLAESIRIAKSGAGGMAQAITILGEKGAGLLPRLSGYFVDVTNRFSEFLRKSDENGKLDKWIETSILRIKELGTVIFEAGRILGGLGKAAEKAGGTTLQNLGRTLKDIGNVVNSKGFQRGLVDVLVAAQKAMTNISDIAGPRVYEFFKTLGKTLTTILPVAGEIAGVLLGELAEALSQTAVHRGVIDLFDGILAAVKLLTPAFKPMAVAFGEFLTLLGKVAVDFAPLLTVALTTLSKIFIALAPSIGEAAGALSTGLLAVFKALAPVLIELAKALGPVLVQLSEGLGKSLKDNAPMLAELAKVIGTALIESLTLLAEYLPEIVNELLPQLLTVAKELIPQIPDLAKGFLELVKALVETDLITSIGQLAGSLIELIASEALPQLVIYLPQLAGSVGALAGSLERLLGMGGESGALGMFFGGMLTGSQIALFAFDSMVVAAEVMATGLLAIFNTVGRDIMAGFYQGIIAGSLVVYNAIKAVGETLVRIVKAVLGIHSPSTVFAEIGQNIIQGLLNGINSLASSAVTRLGSLATSLKGVFTGSGAWLLSPGVALIAGLISGIGSKQSDATGKTRTLRDAIKDVFSNAGSLLLESGRNIAQGLADGISRGVSWVTSAARSIASAAVRAARSALDEHSPSRVFHGIGAYVSIGLADGILSEQSTVIKAMDKLVDAVKGADFSIAPEINADLTTKAGKSVDTAMADDDSDDAPVAPIQITTHNYNPVAEPTSVTNTRTLREAQSMGVFG